MLITTASLDETYVFAKEIADTLKPGDIVTLQGDLGSGKTTFTQGLGKALGITKPITSPTFLLVKSYKIDNGPIKKLYHVDLYRIEKESEISGLGLEEMLAEEGAITVIEWPEKMGSLLPEKRVELQFEYVDENTRKIRVRNLKFTI